MNNEIKEYLEALGQDWKSIYRRYMDDPLHFTQYYNNKKVEFLKQIPIESKIVYLDLNIWINFRDIINETLTDANWIKFYELAKLLSREKKAIFIISAPLFTELEKQNSNENKEILINIMSDLSSNVGLEYSKHVFYYEIFRFLFDTLKITIPEYITPLNNANCILGLNLRLDNIPAINAANKSIIDYIYKLSLKEFYNKSLYKFIDKRTLTTGYETLSTKLNFDLNSIEGVRDDNFAKVRLDEFGGILNASRKVIKMAVYDLYKFQHPDSIETFEDIDESNFVNMIYNCYRLDKIDNFLPSIQISSELHAVIRSSKNRKYKQEHLFDFAHVSSAIPYSDYFFTLDKPLFNMLKDKPLSFEERFKITIENDVESMIKLLEKYEL